MHFLAEDFCETRTYRFKNMSDTSQEATDVDRQAEIAANNIHENTLDVNGATLKQDCPEASHDVYVWEIDMIKHELCESPEMEHQSDSHDTLAIPDSGVQQPLPSDETVDMQTVQPPKHAGTQKKRILRSSKAQIQYLCQYMAKHPELATGDYKTPFSASKADAEWAKLKRALDKLGQNRSVYQWKICWRDQRRKARDERRAPGKANHTAGAGDAVTTPEMPEMREMREMRESSPPAPIRIKQEIVCCGPEESPIGFSPEPCSSRCAAPGAPGAPVPGRRPAALRRARRVLPPDRFINAQLEMNSLIKELVAEVRRGNDLREEHYKYMRGAADRE